MLEVTHYSRALVACGLALALVACSDRDRDVPTGLTPGRPHYAQVATGPVVNSLLDDAIADGTDCTDAKCTLRSAIAFASSGATITFASSLTGTISLTQGQLYLDYPVTIVGPGASTLTVSIGGESVFYVPNGRTASISGLTMQGGANNGNSLVVNSGTLTLTRVVLRDAHVNNNAAGGIFNFANSTLYLVESTVSGNSTSSSGYGGGIENYGTLSVTASTISGNSSLTGGGAIHNGLSWDYAGQHYVYGAATITNSTLSGNSVSSGVGGGIYNEGNLTLLNSTVVGNTSSSGGGGIYQGHAMTLTNVLIAGNSDNGTGTDLYAGGTSNTVTYSLIGSAAGHTLTNGVNGNIVGVATGSLYVGSLADNGGYTLTRALLTGSPAIDAGTNTGCPSADQRGVTRPQNSVCDIGAFEKEGSGLLTPNFTFTLASLPAKTFGDGGFSIAGYAASTNSSGAISFALGAGSAGCSVTSAGVVTISGAGTCIVDASLASDGTYAGAGPLTQNFAIAKAAGSVSISNIPSSALVGASFTPSYSKLGDGTASTTSKTTSVCTVSSGVVHYGAVGTCTLQASITAGTNHLAATGSDQSFTVSQLIPVFTFDMSSLPQKTYGDGSFGIAGYANANSGGTISFDVGEGSVGCYVTSVGLVTVTGAGTCIIEATLAPAGAYAGAGPLSQSFSIARAAGSVTINNIPASAMVGGSFTPAYTTASNGTTSTVSTTPSVCSVSGGVVHYDAAGTCTLHASVSQGTNYLPATGSDQSFTITAAPVFSSSCSYTINSKNDQRNVIVTWTNADPGVTLIEITDGRLVSKAMPPTASGTWSTNVKTGIPTYSLFGGTSRKDSSHQFVNAAACTMPH